MNDGYSRREGSSASSAHGQSPITNPTPTTTIRLDSTIPTVLTQRSITNTTAPTSSSNISLGTGINIIPGATPSTTTPETLQMAMDLINHLATRHPHENNTSSQTTLNKPLIKVPEPRSTDSTGGTTTDLQAFTQHLLTLANSVSTGEGTALSAQQMEDPVGKWSPTNIYPTSDPNVPAHSFPMSRDTLQLDPNDPRVASLSKAWQTSSPTMVTAFQTALAQLALLGLSSPSAASASGTIQESHTSSDTVHANTTTTASPLNEGVFQRGLRLAVDSDFPKPMDTTDSDITPNGTQHLDRRRSMDDKSRPMKGKSETKTIIRQTADADEHFFKALRRLKVDVSSEFPMSELSSLPSGATNRSISSISQNQTSGIKQTITPMSLTPTRSVVPLSQTKRSAAEMAVDEHFQKSLAAFHGFSNFKESSDNPSVPTDRVSLPAPMVIQSPTLEAKSSINQSGADNHHKSGCNGAESKLAFWQQHQQTLLRRKHHQQQQQQQQHQPQQSQHHHHQQQQKQSSQLPIPQPPPYTPQRIPPIRSECSSLATRLRSVEQTTSDIPAPPSYKKSMAMIMPTQPVLQNPTIIPQVTNATTDGSMTTTTTTTTTAAAAPTTTTPESDVPDPMVELDALSNAMDCGRPQSRRNSISSVGGSTNPATASSHNSFKPKKNWLAQYDWQDTNFIETDGMSSSPISPPLGADSSTRVNLFTFPPILPHSNPDEMVVPVDGGAKDRQESDRRDTLAFWSSAPDVDFNKSGNGVVHVDEWSNLSMESTPGGVPLIGRLSVDETNGLKSISEDRSEAFSTEVRKGGAAMDLAPNLSNPMNENIHPQMLSRMHSTGNSIELLTSRLKDSATSPFPDEPASGQVFQHPLRNPTKETANVDTNERALVNEAHCPRNLDDCKSAPGWGLSNSSSPSPATADGSLFPAVTPASGATSGFFSGSTYSLDSSLSHTQQRELDSNCPDTKSISLITEDTRLSSTLRTQTSVDVSSRGEPVESSNSAWSLRKRASSEISPWTTLKRSRSVLTSPVSCDDYCTSGGSSEGNAALGSNEDPFLLQRVSHSPDLLDKESSVETSEHNRRDSLNGTNQSADFDTIKCEERLDSLANVPTTDGRDLDDLGTSRPVDTYVQHYFPKCPTLRDQPQAQKTQSEPPLLPKAHPNVSNIGRSLSDTSTLTSLHLRNETDMFTIR